MSNVRILCVLRVKPINVRIKRFFDIMLKYIVCFKVQSLTRLHENALYAIQTSYEKFHTRGKNIGKMQLEIVYSITWIRLRVIKQN